MSALIFGTILVFFALCLLRGLNTLQYQPNVVKNFSIVIAVKNETENLPFLLVSLLSLDYFEGAFEVIFVDDHSTDGSFQTLSVYCDNVEGYSIYKLTDEQKGKKAAMQLGIAQAKYDWIALTDADCVVPPEWLKTINMHIQNNKQVSMFVGYSPETYVHPFQYFRQLVSAIIYASGIYSGFPFSCSGRNLVFERTTFNEIKGYDGFDQFNSAEDKILLQKFRSAKKIISYMPYPPIFTKPADKNILKNQNLRRYGTLLISSLPWQIFMVVIGLLLIAMPVEFVLWHSPSVWSSMLIIYIFATNLMILLGCILHKERIHLLYLLYALVFPYYLLFQMSRGMIKKWKWR